MSCSEETSVTQETLDLASMSTLIWVSSMTHLQAFTVRLLSAGCCEGMTLPLSMPDTWAWQHSVSVPGELFSFVRMHVAVVQLSAFK